MDFFSKVGETITSKSKDVAKKAKEFTEVSSLRGQISTQEELMNKTFLEIGKTYYETQKDSTDIEPVTADKFREIDLIYAEINRLKHEIDEIKGIFKCPECGGEVPEPSTFCPICGTAMPVKETTPEETAQKESEAEESEAVETIFQEVKTQCPGCGKEVDKDAVFCAGCGTKLKD